MRRPDVAQWLALVALLAGCASIDDDDWRFCVSRETYPELLDKMDANEPVFEDLDDLGREASILIIPLLLSVPLVLDLATLPVTATHDVLYD